MSINKVTIEESPYGDAGATYEGMLGMMNHFVLQLKSYRSQPRTPAEREYLEADIRGYEEILKSNSEANANLFIKTKQSQWFDGNQRFANNEEIVKHLKAEGKWEVRNV